MQTFFQAWGTDNYKYPLGHPKEMANRKKDAVEQYFDQNFQHQTRLGEQDLILNPASYNRKGLLGDFEIYVLDLGDLSPLSGRTGPYLTIEDYFNESWTFILDSDGRIQDRFEGFATLDELETALLKVLSQT